MCFKKIISHKYFPFFIFFLLFFVYHFFTPLGTGDDLYFQKAFSDSFPVWITQRYQLWTSRILIETVLSIMLQLPHFFWCLLDSVLFTSVAYSISKIFGFQDKLYYNWIICFLLMIYPFSILGSAGWYATTINYLWPLSFGLIALLPIKKVLSREPIPFYMYPIFSLSLLFACNFEQMCCIIFCFYFIFLIYYYWRYKKINRFWMFLLILSLISLIFILSCPGNYTRSIAEINTWYPSYANFGLLGKSYLGFVTMFIGLIKNPNLLFYILCFLLFFSVKSSRHILIINAKIPFILLILFHLLVDLTAKFFPYLINLFSKFSLVLAPMDYIGVNLTTVGAAILSLVLFVSILISIYYSFSDRKRSVLNCLVFLAGVASRFIIGFSPTIYASGERVSLFLNIAFIILIIHLLNELPIRKKQKNIVFYGLGVMALLQYVNMFITLI